MQYLRNTNQVQTLDRGIVRGPKGVEATIGYKLTESGADANFLLFNNGVPSYPTIDLNSTESGSTEVFPNSTVTTIMTGSSWPVDGPTLMTLNVTGSGLFFTASSYISTSVLTTNFIASESFSLLRKPLPDYFVPSLLRGSDAVASSGLKGLQCRARRLVYLRSDYLQYYSLPGRVSSSPQAKPSGCCGQKKLHPLQAVYSRRPWSLL